MRARISASVVAVLGLGGCLRPGPFVCSTDAHCDLAPGGKCTAAGSCGYPDPMCPTGLRYDEDAAAVHAGECVGGDTDASTGADDSTGAPATTATTATTAQTDDGTATVAGTTGVTDCSGMGEPCCDATAACEGDLECTQGACTCVVALRSGTRHNCVLVRSAEAGTRLRCWGDGSDGQLGGGIDGPSPPIEPGTGVTGDLAPRLLAVNASTCFIRPAQMDTYGCFDPSLQGRSLLEPDEGALLEIGLGGSHACVSVDDARVRCWGDSAFGQTGGSGADPVTVALPEASATIEVGLGLRHSCARLGQDAGPAELHCWGANDLGQLGMGTTTAPSPMPVAVPIGDDPRELAVGAHHACVRTASSAVWCWGDDEHGQASGTPGGPKAPASVRGLADETLVGVTAGTSHSCALAMDGRAWCWGSNVDGRSDPGGSGSETISPTQFGFDDLPGATGPITALQAGGDHTCAVAGGAVWCWGRNDPNVLQLDGSSADPGPLRIDGLCDGE